jgi:hypothetical protein
MVKHLLIVKSCVLVSLVLSACATPIAPTKPPTKVEIPVVVEVPEPPEFTLPILPIANLTEASKSQPNEVVKAYAATVELLKGEVKARDLALQPYRKKQ